MIKKLIITSLLAGCVSVGWGLNECEKLLKQENVSIQKDSQLNVDKGDLYSESSARLIVLSDPVYKCTEKFYSIKIEGFVEFDEPTSLAKGKAVGNVNFSGDTYDQLSFALFFAHQNSDYEELKSFQGIMYLTTDTDNDGEPYESELEW